MQKIIRSFFIAVLLGGFTVASAQLPPEIKAEETCGEKPVGSSCWMELTNQPECYVWNPDLKEEETVTWSGACSGGFAQGTGTLIWNYSQWRKYKEEATGNLKNGRKHGNWNESKTYFDPSGSRFVLIFIADGPYVNGKRHGEWVIFYWIQDLVQKGPYANGKRHGKWVITNTFLDVEMEVSYVDGKRHGEWVERFSNGRVTIEGSFVDDEEHGDWVYYYSDGTLKSKGPYVNGKKHGNWVERDKDLGTQEGLYVNDKKHGEWINSWNNGRLKGRYVNGKKEGTWLTYKDEKCWSEIYDKGGTSSSRKKLEKEERCREAGLIP